MNKKAEGFDLLGGYTVKMIIAVLCLIILVLIGWYFTTLFTEQTRENQAIATLKELVGMIEYLQKSNLQQTEYFYRSPSGWYIHSDINTADSKPYLCICPTFYSSSCSQNKDLCVKMSCLVTLDDNIKDKEMASKAAEKIIISKLGNCVKLTKEVK